MTGWNLPPGCTNADIERAWGDRRSRFEPTDAEIEEREALALAERAQYANEWDKSTDPAIIKWRKRQAANLRAIRAKRKGTPCQPPTN